MEVSNGMHIVIRGREGKTNWKCNISGLEAASAEIWNYRILPGINDVSVTE